MRASGLKLDIEQRESFEALTNEKNRECRPTGAHDSHARAVARIARYRLVDFAGLAIDLSVNQRDVGFENLTRPKLIGQIRVSCFSFRRHQEARSSFIKPVNDAGPHNARGSGKLLEMKRQGVGQRA